jgi:hypothetical protein
MHAQPFGADGNPISIALILRMAVLVEGNGSHPFAVGNGLIDVPRIKGGISGDVSGELLKSGNCLNVEGKEIADIALVERLSVLS